MKLLIFLAEYYVSILVDRNTKTPILMLVEKRMDIEKVAKDSPEKIIKIAIDPLIGLPVYKARDAAFSFV